MGEAKVPCSLARQATTHRVDSQFLFQWTIDLTIGLPELQEYLTRGFTQSADLTGATGSRRRVAPGHQSTPFVIVSRPFFTELVNSS